jgi:WhiB family redox-sensing transcriptional regulator
METADLDLDDLDACPPEEVAVEIDLYEGARKPPPGPWAADAACLHHPFPWIWYPSSQDEGDADARMAKAVCRQCPVQAQCLTHALEVNEDNGIWGGASERERRKLRRVTMRR